MARRQNLRFASAQRHEWGSSLAFRKPGPSSIWSAGETGRIVAVQVAWDKKDVLYLTSLQVGCLVSRVLHDYRHRIGKVTDDGNPLQVGAPDMAERNANPVTIALDLSRRSQA